MIQDRWADLPVRMASAVVLLLIFSASLYFGRIGVLILGLVAVVAMQWELARMFGLNRWRLVAVAVVAGLGWLPMAAQPIVLTQSLTLAAAVGFLPIMLGAVFISHDRMMHIGYGGLLTVGMLSYWYPCVDVRGAWHRGLGQCGHTIGYWRLYRWTMDRWREVLASCKPSKNLERHCWQGGCWQGFLVCT